MPFNSREDEEEDPTFDEVVGMADRLGLKGKGRMTYIDDHMSQLGYQPVQTRESYIRIKKETEDGEEGTSRWGFGRSGGRGGRPPSTGRQNGDDGDSF